MQLNDKMLYYAKVLSEKNRLGPVHWLFPNSGDIRIAHYLLGKEVRAQVKKTLESKINRLGHQELSEAFVYANTCYDILLEKINARQLDLRIVRLLKQYFECLNNWSSGASLDNFINHKILEINNGKNYPAIILALFLQSETIRCQTGVCRDSTDSIVFWHTEEDEELSSEMHFDKLRIFSFKNNLAQRKTSVYSFIYPHLLPGPAFGWNISGYVQANDSLFLKPHIQKRGLFSNIVTWLTLFSGGEIPPLEIVKALAPYVDGNAITCLYRNKMETRVDKIEFAGGDYIFSTLDKKVGSHLFQVNIFSSRHSKTRDIYETTDKEIVSFMESRIRRTNKLFKLQPRDSHALSKKVYKIMTSYYLDDSGYANTYVKAYLIVHATSQEMDLLVGNGSATMQDNPMRINLIG